MNHFSQLDRRSLLQALALAGTGVAGLSASGSAGAAPRGVDPQLRRGYTPTTFGQVHYWSLGQGPVIVMVHQSAQSSAEYAAIAPLLAEQYRVLAIDLPGHGQSDSPDSELTCDDYADAIIAVLDDLGIGVVHMVGHHGGATVCFNTAVRFPQRVDKVVLSGAGRSEDFDVEKALNTPMTRDLPLDAEGDFLQKTWEVYRRMSAPDTPPEVTFEPFLVSLQNRVRRFDMHYAMYRYDSRQFMDQYDKETLLLRGTDDAYAGDVKALQSEIARSQYAEVPGAAWQFYEYPAESAAAIGDFLG